MSRLIIASNRVADLNAGSQAGGLAVAVGDALRDSSGIWFGWSGDIAAEDARIGLQLERQNGAALATQPLTAAEYEHYYLGYANRALWPVFHNRLDLAEFHADSYEVYRAVNKRFAQSLAALIDTDDQVWIHDYHMIPLAAELRELGIENRIGYFLHIPFPPAQIFMAVPHHTALSDALFAYDVVGFQTANDVENFERYLAETEDRVTPDKQPYRAARPRPLIKDYPIGIDVESFIAMATTPEADERIKRLGRGRIRNHVIGVDRLDYSKGLPDRFRAFEQFLERYPQHRKETVLMQIASPTREELTAYADIRTELERMSGAINGKYGEFDWTPVRYIHRSVPRETLAALFRGSKVGLVTPLRDGMNLVCKEYIAAQREDDPGALILSKFAGAADDLSAALLVNPYDTNDVADALHRAVTMSLDERKERHRALLGRVRAHDVKNWQQSFLADLRGT